MDNNIQSIVSIFGGNTKEVKKYFNEIYANHNEILLNRGEHMSDEYIQGCRFVFDSLNRLFEFVDNESEK